MDQLQLKGKVGLEKLFYSITMALQEYSLAKLRREVAALMKKLPDEFMPFLDSEEDVTEGIPYTTPPGDSLLTPCVPLFLDRILQEVLR